MELKYLLVFLINIFCYVGISDGYILDPPSGKIDIIEFKSYIFGIENSKTLEIIRCEYVSDTGITGSFDVIPKAMQEKGVTVFLPKASKAQGPNSIQNLGNKGECKIEVKNVNVHGAKKWNMRAHTKKSEIVNVEFSVTFYFAISILESKIDVLEGSGIINYLKIKDKNIVLCKLKMNDNEIDINMKSAQQLSKTENTLKRTFSLGENLCGFKLIEVVKTIDEKFIWALTAIDGEGKMYRSNFDLNIKNASLVQNRHLTKSAYFNQRLEIDCGCRFANLPEITFLCNISTARQLYCELYKPDGTLVETIDNKYVIERVSMEHVGRWRYYIGHDHSIDLLDFSVDVIAKGAKTVEVWQKETNNYVTLGCKLVDFEQNPIRFCAMVAPNNQIFNLVAFGATDRYLTLGTSLEKGICQMQIKKPLQSFEIGLWKCEISPKYKQLTGAFISVYSTAVPDYYTKRITKLTFLNERLEITCRVPYFSEYCYIKAPNGTLYQNMNRLDIRLGKCMYTIEYVEKSDNGTWKCFYAYKTGFPDDEVDVEVFIAEVLHYYKRIEADATDTVELMCTSGKVPLKYCRFISPSGVGYQLRNGEKPNRISYHGQGLEYGECGIKITNIQAYEAGTWQCVTELYGRNDEEAIGRIEVEIVSRVFRGPNAAAIGISTSIVVLLIVSIVVIFGIRKWKQKSRNEFQVNNNSENNEDVELFIMHREE